MTLHLAMERVLRDSRRPMTTKELANEVNSRELYLRADRTPVPASQIAARARKYPGLFTKVDGKLRLVHEAALEDLNAELTPSEPTPSLAPVVSGSAKPGRSAPLIEDFHYFSAAEVDSLVPDVPGIYAVRVKNADLLPEPFRSELLKRNDRTIYVGEAKTSLRTRLLNQELRARGHGTFFRSIGAVLGYRPEPGSLIGKANKLNYTFSSSDQQSIIAWINSNMEVAWLPLASGVHDAEVAVIARHEPLLNLQGNPRRMPELASVRALCCAIAVGPLGDA